MMILYISLTNIGVLVSNFTEHALDRCHVHVLFKCTVERFNDDMIVRIHFFKYVSA